MESAAIIPEHEVLIATTIFLIERGPIPYRFSVASGKNLNSSGAIDHLREVFLKRGLTPNFTGNGADILAISDTEWWAIECKGFGSGTPQTHRNNFDRALASVVSYFEDEPQGLSDQNLRSLTFYLGLAIPATRAYLNELRKRVRMPLRKKLNLWILLYEPEIKTIRPILPEEAI